MKKKISQLSKKKYLKTFPIVIKPYNSEYPDWYEEEKKSILSTVEPQSVARINHIGSSAIKGLAAKPFIDILLEIDGTCNLTRLLEDLKKIGFGVELSMRKEDPLSILLGKGFSCEGYADRVFLMHVRYLGDWDELYFKDYVTAHPEVAEEYAELKYRIVSDIDKGLIERLPNGQPNGYSNAKLEYVKMVTQAARAELGNKYRP